MVNCILFDGGDLALQGNGSNPTMTAPWWLLTQITGMEPKWGEKNLQKQCKFGPLESRQCYSF